MVDIMYKVFISDVLRAKTSKLLFSIIGTIALIFIGASEELIRTFREQSLLPAGYCINFLKTALTSVTVVSFLPILASLPFSGTYVDDLKCKFVRFYLIRGNYGGYLRSHIFVCFICGGGTILLGGLLSWGISMLLFMPMEMAAEKGNAYIVQLWSVLGLMFLSGGFWAVVGMAMSTLMESKYIAYASPFVIYYLLVIMCERYFTNAYLLYPPNWVNPEVWPYGAWSAAIILLELTLAFGILFVIQAGRRLREL